MKSTAARWLSQLSPHTTLLAVAAAALIGTTAAASATTAALASPGQDGAAIASAAGDGAAKPSPRSATAPVAKPAPKKATRRFAKTVSLRHSFQLQDTYYNCGPSATRVALSAHGKIYSQAQVGAMLGTTESGTNSVYDVTRVLNQQLGKNRYHAVEIAGQSATTAQIQALKTDVVTALSQGDPVVANVAGTITDNAGDVHSYEGGHYLAAIGYTDHGDTVAIADSADDVGSPYYKIPVGVLANWIATRGYSA